MLNRRASMSDRTCWLFVLLALLVFVGCGSGKGGGADDEPDAVDVAQKREDASPDAPSESGDAKPDSFEVTQCIPDCQGRTCGNDGCGGSCGHCDDPQGICLEYSCVCIPDCGARLCGEDGCGGTCGACLDSEECCYGECKTYDYCDCVCNCYSCEGTAVCFGCSDCLEACEVRDSISADQYKAFLDPERCEGLRCGLCTSVCPEEAIEVGEVEGDSGDNHS